MNQWGQAQGAGPAGVQGNVSVSGGFGGSGGTQGGVFALIVLLGGLAVFYVATRGIQGSR